MIIHPAQKTYVVSIDDEHVIVSQCRCVSVMMGLDSNVHFEGDLDDMVIHDRNRFPMEITEDEIAQLFQD